MAETKKELIGKVILMGVRLSFASLFELDRQTDKVTGKVTERYKANFLFPKDGADTVMAKFKGQTMPILKAMKMAGAEAKTKTFGDEKNWPKLRDDKVCLRDGDLENWDGYEGHWYISTSAKPEDKPSVVTNRKDAKGEWVAAEPGGRNAPYAGCYVNATIVVWAQDNEYGKRINAQVRAVQFLKDGEAFGSTPTDPNEDFDDNMVGSEGNLGDDDDGGVVDDSDDMI